MKLFDYILLKLFGSDYEDEQNDVELNNVPEEIYYQVTEIEQELPFDV